MKKLFKILFIMSMIIPFTTACSKEYDGDYMASGIIVNIKDGAYIITTSNAILSNDKVIRDVNIDVVVVPFYGMRKNGTPDYPAGISILDPSTDDSTDIYAYVREAGDNLVNSKKILGSNYKMASTLEHRIWSSQVERIEDYLVGKDYNSLIRNICTPASGYTTCTSLLDSSVSVSEGALLDFYGFDKVMGATISIANNGYDAIAASLIEMFNSNLQKTSENFEVIDSEFSYSVSFNNNILKVTFTNLINSKDKIIDYVEIPLKISNKALLYNDTKTYIIPDSSYKQVYANLETIDFDTDLIKSSYEK
ncbi:MAG: hypothetical protein PHR33_00965 [Bacilli bacterium]|nr:hypothetical protein [Bacilli bacterium]